MADDKLPSMPTISGDGMGVSLALILFAAVYCALGFGDTMLLAPSRAGAADAAEEQGPLAWIGAAAHLALHGDLD